MAENKIVVVDFGGQYVHLIARRVRQLGVYSEIVLPSASVEEIGSGKGIILSGSPASVCDKGAPMVGKEVFELGLPVLGLCYGHQVIAKVLGGKVKREKTREFGTAQLEATKESELFSGLGERETVWMSHGDWVEKLPPGFEEIGKTAGSGNAAVAESSRKLFGLQFHPEVTHTEHGMQVLSNFVFGICKCEKNWSIEGFTAQKEAEIMEKVGERNVFMLASGGVDSTVALALLHNALGSKRVHALHVDTGFMRKNEPKKVDRALEKIGFKGLHSVDAGKRFFEKLKGVVDPEEKREIIGRLFVEVQQEEMAKLGLDEKRFLLGQGTIYPDTIETAATKLSSKIKTHHNRVPIIKEMIKQGKVLEPLRELYKDEVREVGRELGLPEEIVWRHPFPGPGLAIRCLCSNGTEKIPKNLDKGLGEEAAKFGFRARALPIKSVGVQGDSRTYALPVLLQGSLDWEMLEKASTAITNRFKEVNRCVFALAPEKVESVETFKATLTRERVGLLQEADAAVEEVAKKHGLMREIWQFPVVTLPLKVNGQEGEAVVLRPVESREAMTARFYRMEEKALEEIVKRLKKVKGVGSVFYDVTHKPPGTIEWE